MRENLVSLKSEVEQSLWVYLWLNTENGDVITDYHVLMGKFNISRATVFRTLKKGIDKFSEPSVTVESLKGRRGIKISFVDKKVARKVNPETLQNKELVDICKEYYQSINFDYPNIKDHAKYTGYILNNIKLVCASQGVSIESAELINTFRVFMFNIPNWWIDNKAITLPQLNKHFTKIFNQIKNNGKSKFDKAVDQFNPTDIK